MGRAVAMAITVLPPRRALATAGAVSLAALEAKAAAVRAQLALPAHRDDALAFDSAFSRADGSERGWCNWLVPGHLMVGRYPHLDPIAQPPRAGSAAFAGGPSEDAARAHLDKLHGAGITCFVCLQQELPPQQSCDQWPGDGLVYLPSGGARERFPGPFVRYFHAAHEARVARPARPARELDFVHFPIHDLSLPASDEAAYGLLHQLLGRLEPRQASDGHGMYVHCWGGRGRAGLVGGALLALLRPELGSDEIVRTVQAGYDTRAGAKSQRGSLALSPQTDEQRAWLAAFAAACHALRAGAAS
ncbi:hypothetical protein KFE25_013064 [Diacronema lutheri]|uniref:Tyrosine specific protein phosphatases domain-containing protein n=1 Tax=Diacronema lutheri TaxID=2081491 RepID=A0A8J6C9H3_DIALT|nr:hypothetical protein KFE25_013064 [Diacronema lutheri]